MTKEIKNETIKKKENNKLPKEISKKIIKKVFMTLLKAVGIMFYFIVLNLAYSAIKQERLIKDIEIFAGAFLISGILLLEDAYKKDNGKLAISAIETLCLALHSLSIMHIIALFKYDFKSYLTVSSFTISFYYILKSFVLYTKEKKAYLNNFNDIADIVKKEEPQVKEAKKKAENEEKIKEDKVKAENKKTNSIKSTNKKNVTAKKKTTNKDKTNEKQKNNTEKKVQTTKKQPVKSGTKKQTEEKSLKEETKNAEIKKKTRTPKKVLYETEMETKDIEDEKKEINNEKTQKTKKKTPTKTKGDE